MRYDVLLLGVGMTLVILSYLSQIKQAYHTRSLRDISYMFFTLYIIAILIRYPYYYNHGMNIYLISDSILIILILILVCAKYKFST